MLRRAFIPLLGVLIAAGLAAVASAQQADKSEAAPEAQQRATPGAQADPATRAQLRERCLAERRVDCDELPLEQEIEPDPGVVPLARPIAPSRPILPRPLPRPEPR